MVQQRPEAHQRESGLDWQSGLPILRNSRVTLREVEDGDAPALLTHIQKPRVTPFITMPPATVEGFETFIQWARTGREHGTFACFGVVPAGGSEPVGIIQLWSPADPTFRTAEWGFVLDDTFWGTGLFISAARLLLDFAFVHVGVHRLEARSVVQNDRGNGVLQKLGARREAVLRSAFNRNGQDFDHVLWSMLDREWWSARDRVRTLG